MIVSIVSIYGRILVRQHTDQVFLWFKSR